MLVAYARQLCFGVADGFVTANNRVDGHLTFCLQLRDPCPRVAEFAHISFRFDLSLGVLARRAITFAREAFGLLRQAFERGFELPCDFANSFGDRSL